MIIWLSGVLLLLCRFGLGRASLWRWKRQAIDLGCADLAHRLAHRLDLVRPFTVLGTSESRVPIVWGTFSPVILLPADAKSWPEERLQAVLLHELAHVKRWDYLTYLLGRSARAFFWPNPLIWEAVKRSSIAQEQACDAAVLRSGIPSWEYAEHLLAVVKTLARPSPENALAMSSGLRFKSRMQALLHSATPHRSLTWLETGGLVVIGAGLLAALSAFHIGSSTPSYGHEHLWIEAEQTSLPPGFRAENDDEASGRTYLTITDRADDLDRPSHADPATYSFETSSAGRHLIWARVRVRSNDHDSFWIRVDSTRWIRWNGIKEGDQWHWVQVRDADHGGRPVVFDLSEGSHQLMLARREDDVAIDQLLITTDWNYQPRETAMLPSSLPSTHQVWLEAEEGWLQNPLRVANAPGASSWQYIEAPPNEMDGSSPPDVGHATYSFTVPHGGTYWLWGRVIAETGNSNSFWVRMNDDRWIRWNKIQSSDQWNWDEVHDDDGDNEPVHFELAQGTHQLTIAYRESNTKLDRLLLTSNPTYRPYGSGERAGSPPAFSKELSASEADLVAPMTLRVDSQSTDRRPWIEVPDGPGNDAPEGGPGAATFTFSVPRAGRYVLWGEVLAPHSNDNSFYVSVNGGSEYTWHTPSPDHTTSDWQWDPISSEEDSGSLTNPMIFPLEAGTHRLRIRNREDGTRLRQLRITNLPAPVESPVTP